MKSISKIAMLLFVLVVAHCQNVSTDEFLSGTAIKSPLRISPVNATVIESQSIQFTVTGGNPPYTFKIFTGGGSVSGLTYTAPNSIGSAVVTVNDSSGTSLASLITIISNANCPTNFIPVPFNTAVGTTANFCVAKYEMKCSNDSTGVACSGLPVSKAADRPWVNINHPDAKTACATLGSQYHLITNPEWMTIARSIEATASNWSTGTVSSGALNRGHSDNAPASTLAASTDDDACSGTGQSCAVFNDQRRTHMLANGRTIWDFAGNVKEITDWNLTTGRATSTAGEYGEINIPTGTTEMPDNSFKSNDTSLREVNGIGKYWPENNSISRYGARSGDFNDGTNSGIYNLDFEPTSSTTGSNIGFRCAYQ